MLKKSEALIKKPQFLKENWETLGYASSSRRSLKLGHEGSSLTSTPASCTASARGCRAASPAFRSLLQGPWPSQPFLAGMVPGLPPRSSRTGDDESRARGSLQPRARARQALPCLRKRDPPPWACGRSPIRAGRAGSYGCACSRLSSSRFTSFQLRCVVKGLRVPTVPSDMSAKAFATAGASEGSSPYQHGEFPEPLRHPHLASDRLFELRRRALFSEETRGVSHRALKAQIAYLEPRRERPPLCAYCISLSAFGRQEPGPQHATTIILPNVVFVKTPRQINTNLSENGFIKPQITPFVLL